MSLKLLIKKVKPIYDCSQNSLYALGFNMTGYCKKNIIDFNILSTHFTEDFCDYVTNLFKIAEELPDAVVRSSKHEKNRNLIIPQAAICLDLSQKLKYHIERAWTKDFWKIIYKEAGLNKYYKSSKENWTVLVSMLKDIKIFIDKNKSILIDGGMPDIFESDFNAQLDAIIPLINNFIDSENEAITKTNDKITANNTAYTQLQIIAEAGKIIYKNNQSKRTLFTISRQLHLISGAGSHWRNFTIEINGFKTVKKVIRNSYFKNTGKVPVLVYEGEKKNTSGITVAPEETIRLDIEENIITVKNTSADIKAKFRVRCLKVKR